MKKIELTILIPCLNEELTLRGTIKSVKRYIDKSGISTEILVVDNGCTDNSISIATSENVRIVKEQKRGYGNAIRAGIKNAKGTYIIMGDADLTYDFSNLDLFISKLREGYFLVMGNRYLGGFEKNSMSFSHYYGVKFLSFLGRIKYKVKVGDFHCGLRGFNTKIANELDFNTTGMEFATEMIHKFSIHYNDKICEVPTKLFKTDSNRKPHLRTIRDGFRHLNYILRCKKNTNN